MHDMSWDILPHPEIATNYTNSLLANYAEGTDPKRDMKLDGFFGTKTIFYSFV